MEINNTPSKEEMMSAERLVNKRIASNERKWKTELKHDFIETRRDRWLNYLDRNDGATFTVAIVMLALTTVFIICAVKVTWTICQ